MSHVVSCCKEDPGRGQILIAIKTEISESIDTAPSEVEVEPTQTINEVNTAPPPSLPHLVLALLSLLLILSLLIKTDLTGG